MKLVYDLRKDLEKDPERVMRVQKLTLDESRPSMGLKGVYGLYGSTEWWGNVDRGEIPVEEEAGVIVDTYLAGWDNDGNDGFDFDMRLSDGKIVSNSSYFNDPADVKLYCVGARVRFVYLVEILKTGEKHRCTMKVYVSDK
jgi:hypothetical protein